MSILAPAPVVVYHRSPSDYAKWFYFPLRSSKSQEAQNDLSVLYQTEVGRELDREVPYIFLQSSLNTQLIQFRFLEYYYLVWIQLLIVLFYHPMPFLKGKHPKSKPIRITQRTQKHLLNPFYCHTIKIYFVSNPLQTFKIHAMVTTCLSLVGLYASLRQT